MDKFVKNAHNMSIPSQPPLKKKFQFHNLINISIVFTNKNRGGTLSPPPPLKPKSENPPPKVRLSAPQFFLFFYSKSLPQTKPLDPPVNS